MNEYFTPKPLKKAITSQSYRKGEGKKVFCETDQTTPNRRVSRLKIFDKATINFH